MLPGEKEDPDLGQESATSSGGDMGGIEQSGCEDTRNPPGISKFELKQQLNLAGGPLEISRTILKNRRAVELDHRLIRIVVLFDVTHLDPES